jgi:hypothetical protein
VPAAALGDGDVDTADPDAEGTELPSEVEAVALVETGMVNETGFGEGVVVAVRERLTANKMNNEAVLQ